MNDILKTLIILLLFRGIAIGQCEHDISGFVSPLADLKSTTFSVLDSQLSDVRIVGYGEDTHGSAEFTLLAKELMEYLSVNHGFNTIILETGLGEGEYLNDYIQGRRDDIREILEDQNSTWRYRTEEFLVLMDWLRAYNEKDGQNIRLFGSEMQYVVSDVDRVEEYLSRLGYSYQVEGFDKHLWQNITESEKTDAFISYVKLKQFLTEHKDELIEKSSESEYNIIWHHGAVIGQFVTAINQELYQRKMDMRDMYIAENIERIMWQMGDGAKVMYWSHNDHVGNWIANGIVDVAGHYLKKRYGDAYFNIATDFGSGSFMALPHNPQEVGGHMRSYSFEKIDTTTFTYCIKQEGSPHALVHLREARKDESLRCMLNEPLKVMYGAGAQEWGRETRIKDIGRAFDAIIYIDTVSDITFLKE